MTAWVVALLALSLAAPPLGRGNALQVATEEPALGVEIAHAARRYLNGTIQVRSLPAVPVETLAAHEPLLVVRQQPGDSAGQRWSLVLSSSVNHQVRRLLTLHEAPSRFDLAEAVAIELPDMLSRLAETTLTPLPREAVPASHAPPASRLALTVVPRPTPVPHPRPPVENEPVHESEKEPPAEGPIGPPANLAPPPPPAPEAPLAAEPAQEPHPAAVSPLPVPVVAKLEPPQRHAPALAVGLLTGGAMVLATGLVTGIAALVTAQQVNTPVQMHFDRDLDNLGKSLNTATIVLDCVGAASLIGGASWWLSRAVKSRRGGTQVSLLPAGRVLVVGGTF
jgi:hypothetical protein